MLHWEGFSRRLCAYFSLHSVIPPLGLGYTSAVYGKDRVASLEEEARADLANNSFLLAKLVNQINSEILFAEPHPGGTTHEMYSESKRLTTEELLAELGWLRRLARSLVGSAGVEDDLVQETWLAARVVKGGVSKAWLTGTLRRLIARWYRSESRMRQREQMRTAGMQSEVDSNELLERNELFGQVLRELRSLDVKYSTVLLLLYQEGLNVNTAAARIGIPVDTLRWRHREGLDRLRKRLDANSEGELQWRSALIAMTGLPCVGPSTHTAALNGAHSMFLKGSFGLMKMKLITGTCIIGLAIWSAFAYLGAEVDLAEKETQGPDRVALTGPMTVRPKARAFPLDEMQKQARVPVSKPTALPVPKPAAGVRFDPDILVVWVFDESNSPVVGAQVWKGESADPVGEVRITDGQGRVRMPMPKEAVFYLSGMTETRYGRSAGFGSGGRSALPSGSENRMRLLPDADLAVRVTGAQGTPIQGLPMGIVHTGRTNQKVFKRIEHTNAEGLATLRHVLYQNRKPKDFEVGPAILLRTRADLSVSITDLPNEPLHFTLPPTGSLRLRVVNSRGEPNLSVTQVQVVIDPAAEAGRSAMKLRKLASQAPVEILQLELLDGVAFIPFIGLGLGLIAYSSNADSTDTTLGVGRGPLVAGALAEITLEAMEESEEIIGVALRPDGTLLKDCLLKGEIAWPTQTAPFNCSTDAQGRFRISPDGGSWGVRGQATLKLVVQGNEPTEFHSATLAIPRRVSREVIDLGAQTLHSVLPFLAGRAVDASGDPIESGLRSVYLIRDFAAGKARASHHIPLITFIRGGRFALFSDSMDLPEMLTLGARVKGKPKVVVEAPKGTQDLQLCFAEGHVVTGTVNLKGVDKGGRLGARFFLTDDSGVRSESAYARVTLNGRFYIDGLKAGQAGDLEIHHALALKGDQALASIEGVRPAPKSALQDPRLASIPLSGMPNEFVLHLVDGNGSGIFTASLELDSSAASIPLDEFDLGEKSFFVRSKESHLTGLLRAPGFLESRVSLNPGEQTIELQRGPELIVYPTPAIWPIEGAHVELLLSAVDQRAVSKLIPLAEGGYSGSVSKPGVYLVRARIMRNGVRLSELPLSDDATVLVLEPPSGFPQSFVVPFSKASFGKLVQ